MTISGVVQCLAHGLERQQHGRRSVAGVAIKVVDEEGGQLAEAVTDADGKYRLSFPPKCPGNLRLKVILDPRQTGYQGGVVEGWSYCLYWLVYSKYPPTFVMSQCVRDEIFGGRAKPLAGLPFPESKSFDCTRPPPEGSQGLSPCPAADDACISSEMN